MSIRALLPSLVTALTLTCGLAALEATRVGAWDWALRLILLAAVSDGIDGALARHLDATSRMGEQLDSLADVIAFGAAPAFLFSTFLVTLPGPIRFGVALAFVLGGAFRLARFHAQPLDGVFAGLPITAAGPLLALAVAGPFEIGPPGVAIAALALTVLMVCSHPFPKVVRTGPQALALLALGALPLILWPRTETLAALGVVTLGAYVAWGLAGRATTGLLERVLASPRLPGHGKVGQSGRTSP